MKRALSQLSLVLAGFVSVGALLHASAAEPEGVSLPPEAAAPAARRRRCSPSP